MFQDGKRESLSVTINSILKFMQVYNAFFSMCYKKLFFLLPQIMDYHSVIKLEVHCKTCTSCRRQMS